MYMLHILGFDSNYLLHWLAMEPPKWQVRTVVRRLRAARPRPCNSCERLHGGL